MSLSSGRGSSPQEPHSPPRAREEAVRAHVEAAFRQANYMPLRRIRCDYQEGVLTLRGRVPTFHLKQLAQTLVQSLELVLDVNNRVEVGPAAGDPRSPR